MVKNPPSNAGVMGSIPGQGTKISHTTSNTPPHDTATEPTCSRAHACNERNLHATSRKRLHTEMKTQRGQN